MKTRVVKHKIVSRSAKVDVLVVGGGSFGTALGSILARNGRVVRIYVREKKSAEEINRRHTNKLFFPGSTLPSNLEATTDLAEGVAAAPVILLVVPSKNFREAARNIGNYLSGDQILIHATKGIEPDSFKRMSEILREETCALKIGVISGPTLAVELMNGNPAGATIASHFDEVIQKTKQLFAGSPLLLFGGKDIIGAEIGGAFKNIIALMSGAASGLGFGDNTRALIVTSGLFEMTRYGVKLGAEPKTFLGLAGVGDLTVTCTSPLSRNFKTGRRFALGEKLETILGSSVQVVEGIPTTRAVYDQARQLNLDLPMVQAVYEAFFERKKINELLDRLMGRSMSLQQALEISTK